MAGCGFPSARASLHALSCLAFLFLFLSTFASAASFRFFHLLRVKTIDQALFRDRRLRDTASQPLQSTPEMESGKEGYTTHAKFEAKTYQRNVPRLGAHLDPPKILGILGEIRHHVLRPPGGVGVGEKLA